MIGVKKLFHTITSHVTLSNWKHSDADERKNFTILQNVEPGSTLLPIVTRSQSNLRTGIESLVLKIWANRDFLWRINWVLGFGNLTNEIHFDPYSVSFPEIRTI